MSDLKYNVTSDWIKATGFFGHTPQRISVSLFVEGEDDIPLWEEAVKPYQNKYNIKVTTNKMINPEDGNGKAMLLSMSGLGPSKIIAVDADYDLLIDNYSPFTEVVRNGGFVVNTTWYSIENILMQKTHSIPLLESFSKSSKSWFMDYLQKVSDRSYEAPIAKFGEILLDLNIQKLAASNDFSPLSNCGIGEGSINAKTIEAKLSEIGCNGSNIWKVMRGHNLWNTIIKPVEEKLLKGKIKEITDKQMADSNHFDRVAAMNQLGVYTSVREYLEEEFYTGNVDGISIPPETREKLNKLFIVR